MDILKVRQRFMFYRQEIARLNEQIEALQSEFSEQADRYCSTQSRLESRLRQEHAAAENARREEESRRWQQESEIRQATRKIEDARSYGGYISSYVIDDAIRKLKRLS